MRTSGISSPFGGLSRSPGWVPHVLLTRSPLGLPECCHSLDLVRLACVKRAASVRPEPGSNSPSRTPRDELEESGVEPAPPGGDTNWHRTRQANVRSVQLTRCVLGLSAGTPALAFSSSLPLSRCAARRAHRLVAAPSEPGVGADPLFSWPPVGYQPAGAKGHSREPLPERQLRRRRSCESRSCPAGAGRSGRGAGPSGRRRRRRSPAPR